MGGETTPAERNYVGTWAPLVLGCSIGIGRPGLVVLKLLSESQGDPGSVKFLV